MYSSRLNKSEKKFVRQNHCQLFFPDLVEGNIGTERFLAACQVLIKMIEKFGKIFAPVKYDMQSNVDKLSKVFVSNKEGNATLQDMILLEIAIGESMVASDALLWLRRCLLMIQIFFEKIIEDFRNGSDSEDLVASFKKSYKEALEPYHGWMAQQLFNLLSRMIPPRSQFLRTLFENLENEEAMIQELDNFTAKLKTSLIVLDMFYGEHC